MSYNLFNEAILMGLFVKVYWEKNWFYCESKLKYSFVAWITSCYELVVVDKKQNNKPYSHNLS